MQSHHRHAMLALSALLAAGAARAHNSLMIPVPRNAADGADGVYPGSADGAQPPGGLTCTCANGVACPMGEARKLGGAGQGCLWWSQGCSIGCDYCLTDPKHPANKGQIPTKAINGNPPHSDKVSKQRGRLRAAANRTGKPTRRSRASNPS
eukprot:SAG22_NODE_3054_length_1980_cov_3.925611_1_plen_151_part_00